MKKEHNNVHTHDGCDCGHDHGTDMNMEKEFDKLTMEEVVYGNQHVLNILLDLLIEKGLISEQELKDKLDSMISQSEDISDVKIDVPEMPEDEEK